MPDMIRPADLLLDTENPRLRETNVGQNEAITALATAQGKKLPKLASDIVAYGLNPSELPIVMPSEGNPGRFVVLDGNRRLCALRVLENPELLADITDKSVLKAMRKLSGEYQDDPIPSIPCEVFPNRDDASHWIELRHTGENAGAGLVRWGSEEAHRYSTRHGQPEPHIQALDLLERRGLLSPAMRKALPVTSFRRLLGTPEVRAKLGVEVQRGKLMRLASEKAVADALLHVVKDLASGKMRVADIYHVGDRVAYAKKLPKSIVVTPTRKRGTGIDVTTGAAQETPKRGATAKIPKARTILIPRDCVLAVFDPRCLEIEKELRMLKLDTYTNAISVLFRVFVELSTDCYITARKLPPIKQATLQMKMNQAADDLIDRSKLSKDQAKGVRRASSKDSLLAASTPLMNAYVHSQWVFPSPADLRSGWSNLQSYMIAVWAP